MIDVLNNWMMQSSTNFNVIVGITAVLYVGSLIVLFFISTKFGQPDERTNAIKLKIISVMFGAQLIMNAIFITLVDSSIDYFRQFLILFQGIVFLVGAIYAMFLYQRELR